jgi:hypothetical protein
MIVFLIILLILGLVLVESINLFELGSPPKDSDILEMLEKYGADYDVEKKWNDKFILKASFRLNIPGIHQTKCSIIFPYYIDDVGVVPIWYNSSNKIKQIFGEKISASKYTITKRDKLGLNKNN